MSKEISNTINIIISLYEKYGARDYIGEPITQYDHALQCAIYAYNDIRLKKYKSKIRFQIIAAAFLHDIGHLIGVKMKQ